MRICIGIRSLLQEVKANFIKLVDFICCWSFLISFFVLFWGYSCKFVIMGGRLKELFTGLWSNWMTWRRHLLFKPWKSENLVALSGIARLLVVTRLLMFFKKVQFIVKLTSWYFWSRCPWFCLLPLSITRFSIRIKTNIPLSFNCID